LTRRPDSSGHPLSFAQERLWFLWQLEPAAPVYNRPTFLRLSGPLDHKTLERVLNEIPRRHEVLRAVFPAKDGKPYQIIQAWRPQPLPCENLSGLDFVRREEELRRLASSEATKPFDLIAGPVMRATLVELEREDHVLLLVFHHIVFDGWSARVLVDELTQLYQAFQSGAVNPVEDISFQYSDFAAWQRRCYEEGFWDEEINYWQKELSGDLPIVDLPIAASRPDVTTYRGGAYSFMLPHDLTAGLTRLGHDQQATMFMLLLAALNVLLYRYSGQEDIVVGCPIAGRTELDTESMLGCFINILGLRTEMRREFSFRELLARVREKALAAYQNQSLPFEKVVEAINPARIVNRTPVFQTLFILRNIPARDSSEGATRDLRIAPWDFDDGIAQFDLTLDVSERTGSFNCLWKYSAELFQPEDIQRLAECYATLLSGIVANPDQPISELPLLPEAERHKILVDWNRTARDFPRDQSIHHLFENQVQRSPDAVAIVCGKQSVTYRELNERSNQLAHHLRSLGVISETLVAVFLERSVDMIAALLGILKAGGAYLPLDLAYPKDRLAYMMEDARAPILLTQKSLLTKLPGHGARSVCLDEPLPPNEKSDPASRTTPNGLAYVIYTSGSTGRPKGVAIEHRGVIALVHWAFEIFRPEELAGVLFSSSLCFDLSVLEVFVPLCAGGKVIVAGNALSLPTLPGANQITLINAVPSAMAELIRLNAIPDCVRVVILGGEALSTSLVKQTYEQASVEKVFDLYGPTEVTVYATWALRKRDGPATIGRPIADKQVYILDRQLQPVPIGVVGEIHVGGVGLARGYLNQPALTAEKFIADPFSRAPGARLYRTGDRGRFLADGNIEFLGRLDHQVKIRGFRVELGEIETTLTEYPDVRQAVAVVATDTPGSLIAYVVAKDSRAASAEKLREFLKQKLPDYMTPARFVFLESLPLTPSGKLDRCALPNWVDRGDKPQTTRPRTTLEAQLTQIWQRILRSSEIGVRDNFFDLGGHSLLAVQLITEINRTLHVDLRVLVLFQNPTIEQLANAIQRPTAGPQAPTLVTLRDGRLEFPLIFINPEPREFQLGKLLNVDQAIFGTDVPFSLDVLKAAAANDIDALPEIRDLAAEHTALILNHQPAHTCFLAGYSFGGRLAFEVAHQLQSAGRRVEAIFLLDTAMRASIRLPKDWRWLKLWFGTHLRNTFVHGLSYLRGKIASRWEYESGKVALKFYPPDFKDLGAAIPWALREKIYGKALRTYEPSPLQSRGVLFRSQEELRNIYTGDLSLGWRTLFSEQFEIIDVPGDHDTFLQEPHIRVLAEKLNAVLNKYRAISTNGTSS
jgi:aspartate racemase